MFKFYFLLLLLSTQVSANESSNIRDVIQDYFVGYQKAEVSLIKKVFYPTTRLLSVDNGQVDVIEMKDWLNGLEERYQRGDIRTGKLFIDYIDVTNETSSVKLRIRFDTFEFTDYLSLLYIDGHWMIVGKIYHFQAL